MLQTDIFGNKGGEENVRVGGLKVWSWFIGKVGRIGLGPACEEAKQGLSLNIEKIVDFRIHWKLQVAPKKDHTTTRMKSQA
jgi:hypothetical protein